MITPKHPENEKERLAALARFNLLDTLPEKDFDNITALAAGICEVPVSLVALMDADRNFFKSHHGIDFNESPRDLSFCGHAILTTGGIFEVEDARKDVRFQDNPLVLAGQAIFYAGVPLVDEENFALGTLCIFDSKPRELKAYQKNALLILSEQVMALFEARKKNTILKKLQTELERKNVELKDFAGIISHDMKLPLSNIIMTTDLLRNKYSASLDAKALKYLDYLKESSFKLSDYITGLLLYYESEKTTAHTPEIFDIHQLLEEIVDLLNINIDCEINLPDENMEVVSNKIALEQIFLNLLGNSIKYNQAEQIVISIEGSEDENFYYFSVIDNGMGIPKSKLGSIFDLFATVGSLDRNGNKGNGIGLSTVKRLVTDLGGEISVLSKVHNGTIFKFSIAKRK